MKEPTEIILGPPGTGKTTACIGITEDILASSIILPQEIAFVTFTRKGATEALERARIKFEMDRENFPWFKTLHSMAFHFCNIEKSQVMGYTNYIDICNLLGITITSHRLEEGMYLQTTSKGDRLFFLENLARVTRKSYREIWEQNLVDDIHLNELELLATTLKQYKDIRNKVDFTDMIIRFNALEKAPPIKALIVDEAQDLSPIQWTMVEILAKNVEHFYIAGDDDQAIYNWAGADVDYFLNLPGKRRVLAQSYRVPANIHALATSISKKIRKRAKKDYKPRSEPGRIEHHADLSTIDMSSGTWLLLARNIAFLPEMAQHCLEKGHLFESKHSAPIPEGAARAIVHWEALRKGEKIYASEAKNIYEFMRVKSRVKFGFKKQLEMVDDNYQIDIMELQERYGLTMSHIWHEALNFLKGSEISYFIEALKRGEKMTQEPRIKIATIHSVKGGEADNVVLCPDMTNKTYLESQNNPDDEARVWYVAVTRAKQCLYVLHPRTQCFWPL